MTESISPTTATGAVVIVDGDILSRHAIADYLRHCGYDVVEAASTDEAVIAVKDPSFAVDIVLCDIQAVGTRSGFELSTWIRGNHSEVDVKLAGNLTGIVDTATNLCEESPHFARPYEPQAVVDYIKQLRATRDRTARSFSRP
jgi:DNA-binding response OmpR family regulator